VAASYAHPILTPQVWMLVDSSGERQTANALYGIREALKRRRIVVRVLKPLFDHFVGEFGVRPDFELELTLSGGCVRRLLIETMGSKNRKYLLGKQGPHQRMRQRGDLILDWRDGGMTPDDHIRADQLLRAEVFSWVSRLTGRTIR
jgi:hypothetical protein